MSEPGLVVSLMAVSPLFSIVMLFWSNDSAFTMKSPTKEGLIRLLIVKIRRVSVEGNTSVKVIKLPACTVHSPVVFVNP